MTRTEGPLLILAGAGSGKTKTLAHRIAYLLINKKIAPANILAVTFTNKAAGEMLSRVLKLLGRAPQDRLFMPFLGTFHSICVRILREHAEALGLARSFVIFDGHDSQAAIKQAMRQLSIDEKRYHPSLIKELISSAKNELIDASRYQQLASGPAQAIAAKVYPLYQKLLREAQALDFDDLLMETVRLWRGNKQILKKWQGQWHYILIDEYQDTNHAQYQFAKLLAAVDKNICVVGDDWQSIYSWRGANFRNILDFERDYPKAKVIKLEQNYRSTQQILSAAQTIISKNKHRSDKTLWTAKTGGLPVQVMPVQNETHEAELIVQAVQDGMASGNPSTSSGHERSLSDFAVLYRTNAQSRSLEEAFIRHGLPYRVVGGVRFYERKEIKDVLAYLNFIYQPSNLMAWRRIINLPPRGLGETSLQRLLAWQQQSKLSLYEAIGKAEAIEALMPRARRALQSFYRLIERLRQASQSNSLPELIELVIKRTGYLDYLNDGSLLAADRIENVQELISVAHEYDEIGLTGFLEEVALISDIDEYDAKAEAVTLMTLHSAKGLEFPVVFMAGMEEGVFPHSRSLFDQQQLEEERRLCYVGMTRAKEELYLIHAAARLLYGGVMHNPPARFISELTEAQLVTTDPVPAASLRKHATYDIEAGDEVKHPQFGRGIVVTINEDEATIDFKHKGTKRLSLAQAQLEKI